MAKQDIQKLVEELTNKSKDIKLSELSALQTSANQKVLAELQIASGELLKSVATKEDKNTKLEKHDSLVQSVDTAGLVGLISNEELADYYLLLDKTWSAIEKEK